MRSWVRSCCWPRLTPCCGSARALLARPDVIQRTGELPSECPRCASRFSRLPHLLMTRNYARGPTDPGRHARTRGDGRATSAGRRSAAEAALALGVRADGAQEVHAPEVGPQRLAEVELRVGRLPQQEAAEALLAGRADHQVRIRLTLGVEVLGDVLDVDQVCELLQRRASSGMLGEQRTDGVGDLAPPAVADGHVDQQPVDVAGGLLPPPSPPGGPGAGAGGGPPP